MELQGKKPTIGQPMKNFAKYGATGTWAVEPLETLLLKGQEEGEFRILGTRVLVVTII